MKELDGRRYKCAMMMSVDEGLKNISDALEATGQASNTLIAFTSDNGGSWTQGSSNFPLRGGKTTLWEGGIRVPSFIYSPSTDILPYQNWDWNGLHYQTDWYPTFVGFAEKQGENYAEAWDGINHWDTLVNQKSGSERTEFAYINEVQEEHGVLRINDLKLLVNQTRYPGWYLPPNQEWSEYPNWTLPEGITAKEPRVKSRLSLFNIAKDPSETLDLMNPPKPKRPEGMVRPNKDDYDLEPKPVRPTNTSDPNYEDLLYQYKYVDKPAWDEKKAIYDADLAAFLVLKEAYDLEIKAWRKERRANREVGYEMLNYLYEKYWGEMWKPTITDKLPSNPVTLNFTIPNYTPLTYVWSSGWCDATNDADPST
nr:hypothetical protein BaRGS_035185 [Batillaria attramentaria]